MEILEDQDCFCYEEFETSDEYKTCLFIIQNKIFINEEMIYAIVAVEKI